MADRLILPLRSKIAAGLVTALLVLVVGAMSFWTVIRAAESFEEVNHTGRVLLEQQKLLASLADVETAARGYVITGDSSFLAPFGTAKGSIPETIARLRALTTDHPEQQTRLDTLESVANDLVGYNDQIVDYKSTPGPVSATDMINIGPGKAGNGSRSCPHKRDGDRRESHSRVSEPPARRGARTSLSS